MRLLISEEKIKLLAVHDFDLRQMRSLEKMQLRIVLESHGLMIKGEEIKLNNSLRGGMDLLVKYLWATKQIKIDIVFDSIKERKATEKRNMEDRARGIGLWGTGLRAAPRFPPNIHEFLG